MRGLSCLDDFFRKFMYYFSDMNNIRFFRRLSTQASAFSSDKGFTLIELVMVIAIIGILASLAVPRFQDLSGAAKASATRAGLGSLRSVLAIRYAASATAGATASYPTLLNASDFAGGDTPRNSLPTTATNGVSAVSITQTGTTTNGTNGFWFVSLSSAGAPAGADYGRAGAYSDGTVNTSTY